MTDAEFVEKHLAGFAANLNPAAREHFESLLTPSGRERLKLPASTLRTRHRDDAVRWIREQHWPDLSTNAAAIAIETALDRYAATGWPRHTAAGTRPLADPERWLHRLLDLNDGEVLSARSIRRILS